LVEEGKKQRRSLLSSKAVKGQSSLANPLHLQTFTSPSIPPERGLNFFSVTKMSEDQPGDVRSPSFCLHQLSDPVPYCRQSPRLRKQLGHSSSNRVPHTFPPLLNLLIHSAASQTSLAISPRLPPRLSFSPPFPSQSFPVRHNPSETSCSLYHYIPLVGLQRTGASVRSSSPQYRKAKHQRIAPAAFSNGSSVHSRANTLHVTKRWVQRRSQSCCLALYTDGPLTVDPITKTRPLNPVLGEYVITCCCGLRI
jgi:hypothetical protein